MLSEWRSGVAQHPDQLKRPMATGSTTTSVISASASRMFTNYEISDEISRKQVQCLERKYGGRIRAHAAARTIQRAYRRYRLTQQWNNLQFNGSTKKRYDRAEYYGSHVLPEGHQLTAHDRQHLRQLALSQPSLRYNPITSLRAQLRAERFATNCSSPSTFISPLNGSGVYSSPRAPPSPRPIEPPHNSTQRPYIELMSPRLTQRRSVMSQNFYTNGHYGPILSNGIHGATIPSTAPIAQGVSPLIWVPRKPSIDANVYNDAQLLKSDYVMMNGQSSGYQTNSLPRLDRRRERIYQDNKAGSSIEQTQQMREFSDLKRRRLYRIALNFFNK